MDISLSIEIKLLLSEGSNSKNFIAVNPYIMIFFPREFCYIHLFCELSTNIIHYFPK